MDNGVVYDLVSNSILAGFLLNAKRRTYAGGGNDADTAPLLQGSRQLEHREGDLLYREIYFGTAFIVGQETVYEGTKPVWAMSYAGGMLPGSPLDASDVYGFLRAALRKIEDRPFRGPSRWSEGWLAYVDDSQGDIGGFRGTELITYEGKPVYQLHYNGGLLR